MEKSFNEADDLTIGFKGIINDMYCKDTSRRISAGYLQKQREGIVIVPPLEYFKDRNTDEVIIIEEEAEIVRRIYDLYLQGYGLKNIAHQLNAEGAISDANLRLLVDSIVISEKDKKLHIKINLNAKFERHKDCYDEEGNLTERMFIA